MDNARRKHDNDKDAVINDFFNNIYFSLYCKGSKGLFKGCM